MQNVLVHKVKKNVVTVRANFLRLVRICGRFKLAKEKACHYLNKF